MEDFLSHASRRTPFTVPEGYFDTLSERVLSRVAPSSEPSRPTVSFPVRMRRIALTLSGLAAVALVAVFSVRAFRTDVMSDADAAYAYSTDALDAEGWLSAESLSAYEWADRSTQSDRMLTYVAASDPAALYIADF